jgi:hypothetical protein
MLNSSMPIYICEKHRAVEADTFSEAAGVFALRKARAKYGSSAQVGALRLDCWSQDGTLSEYEAFIGHSTGRNQTTGNNVRFTVRRSA